MRKFSGVIVLVVLAIIFIVFGLIQKGTGRDERRIAVIPKGTTHLFWESVHAGA